MVKDTQVSLLPEEMPTKWYNIVPDIEKCFREEFPKPEQGEQLQNLGSIMIEECLKQELSNERYVEIPDGILELYAAAGRPRPLFRAKNLEKALDLSPDVKMYYKGEYLSPPGSHKLNTALAQAYYAKKQGVEGLVTETGAGQWGSSLAYAASLVDIKKCVVFWVKAVHDRKPERLFYMRNLYGAEVYASPSNVTQAGRNALAENENNSGTLGIAISEGLEYAKENGFLYSLGSVLNHVLMHQTIIGLETKKQFEKIDEYPDVIISCLGGGSNFGGFALPFVGDVLNEGKEIKFIAAQSASAPNLLKGEYRYDYADHAEKTPRMKMYTLGHDAKLEPPILGDGLRYHAAAPIISYLRNKGLIDVAVYPSDEENVLALAKLFIKTQGVIPAPESAYSIAAAIYEADLCRMRGEKATIAFNISGHGFLDFDAYMKK